MSKLHVAYTEDGTIVSAAVEQGDLPQEEAGVTVAEFDVPSDVGDQALEQYAQSLRVDTQAGTLKYK